ncbi:TIGR02147 family protein [Bdellovibrio sp.]|uniref:TIGR02147 family protein n=1 Tax=Bdellovibrio sp. TaxID=28201 RepID=UPI0039E603A3
MANAFQTALVNLFEDRRKKNKRYSLRAFAKDAQKDPSSLNRIMQGTRIPSEKVIREISRKLKFTDKELEMFVRDCKVSRLHERELASLKQSALRTISRDEFKLISDWIHFAILECLNLKDFDHTVEYIARRLCTPVEVVEEALARLIQLEFLKFEDGRYELLSGNTSIFHLRKSDEAMMKMQGDLLDVSKEALMNVPLEERHHSSLIFSFRSSDLPVIAEHLRVLRKKLNDQSNQTKGRADQVYCISLSVVPLTK